MSKYMKVKELSEALKCNRRTILKWIERKTAFGVKFIFNEDDGCYMIERKIANAYIKDKAKWK